MPILCAHRSRLTPGAIPVPVPGSFPFKGQGIVMWNIDGENYRVLKGGVVQGEWGNWGDSGPEDWGEH